jgi:hypothetical protein
MLTNHNNLLKNGLFPLGILILIVGGYEISYFNSIPPISAQVIPRGLESNDNTTINSESDSTTITHTSYTIEGSNALLNLKLPLIKKAVVSQIYTAMGLTQKAGVNNTATNLNALITNEIDNSTSSSSSLETTKSLAGAQVANAIHKITSMINSNAGQDLPVGKVVVDNEAKCSTSAAATSIHCNLNIRIHK